ncbi:hypothetical protein DCAR_0521231 [Daucus carota subsp. sativus]|uniref:Uncharacterized protein n=1 Tax=Daucus carota subsp. sativus TaxID=79200 RepID=A0AAF0X5H6_DAUCS|nr:PREDICTED: uncharacterized protein At4g13200, chloroplastic [Daucus carota subsp. sativus]WOH01845.1 hypothetical protein DCAR_0521231 [Daucus carota subsp. sativus]
MRGLLASSPPSYTSSSSLSLFSWSHFSWSSKVVVSVIPPASGAVRMKPRLILRCNSSSSSGPGGPSSPGENENKTVLDAFFLGKALAETLNERIESTVGEILSTIGRLQAEQQKQVEDFQEEVLERAKRSKDKAAKEALEVQGLIPKSSAIEASTIDSTVPSVNETQSIVITDEDPKPTSTPTPDVPNDS